MQLLSHKDYDQSFFLQICLLLSGALFYLMGVIEEYLEVNESALKQQFAALGLNSQVYTAILEITQALLGVFQVIFSLASRPSFFQRSLALRLSKPFFYFFKGARSHTCIYRKELALDQGLLLASCILRIAMARAI